MAVDERGGAERLGVSERCVTPGLSDEWRELASIQLGRIPRKVREKIDESIDVAFEEGLVHAQVVYSDHWVRSVADRPCPRPLDDLKAEVLKKGKGATIYRRRKGLMCTYQFRLFQEYYLGVGGRKPGDHPLRDRRWWRFYGYLAVALNARRTLSENELIRWSPNNARRERELPAFESFLHLHYHFGATKARDVLFPRSPVEAEAAWNIVHSSVEDHFKRGRCQRLTVDEKDYLFATLGQAWLMSLSLLEKRVARGGEKGLLEAVVDCDVHDPIIVLV